MRLTSKELEKLRLDLRNHKYSEELPIIVICENTEVDKLIIVDTKFDDDYNLSLPNYAKLVYCFNHLGYSKYYDDKDSMVDSVIKEIA